MWLRTMGSRFESSICINTFMNYRRIYDDLITRRLDHTPTGYVERHHIQMRSLGGSDDESNLVKLTSREHYVAHLLLHKILRCSESAYALWMMQCKSSTHEERPYIKSSRMYEWSRKEFAKYISRNNKVASKGERNSQHGTRWICNVNLKENRKISKTDELPQGWILGRNKWNMKPLLGTQLKRVERNQALVSKVNLANIDFSKHGWATKLGKIINQSPQKARRWLSKYMPGVKAFHRMGH